MIFKRHKLAINMMVLVLLMVVGFNDTGIFVREFKYIDQDGKATIFQDEENVSVIRETDDTYIVSKDVQTYEVPRDTMIRTTRRTGTLSTNKETKLYSLPSENSLVRSVLEAGTIVTFRSENKGYGIYDVPSTGRVGYIKLEDVSSEVKDNITYGLAIVSKTILNNNSSLLLLKGGIVNIVGYEDQKYVVLNENMDEFTIPADYVTLTKSLEEVTRSAERGVSASIGKVVEYAHSLIGKRYIYAATGPNAFDCSGLTYYIFKNQLDIIIPRVSGTQATVGTKVDRNQLIPGDLVFFNTVGTRISHVGLYIGDGNMIHASSSKGQVRIDTIDSGWYYSRFVTARRIIK